MSQLPTTKAFLWLPLYDYFKIQREGEELEQLKVLWKEYGAANCPIPKDSIDLLWRLLGLLKSEGYNFLGDCIPRSCRGYRTLCNYSAKPHDRLFSLGLQRNLQRPVD
ncbi:hypothetical protein QUA62_28670 [Microcoleus sp. MON1_C1]|uniref:hypothetical protein n=1 Tax=Microcoleus sp. MON1_C1 TaxID=2818827 RepID=UPI002FD761A5